MQNLSSINNVGGSYIPSESALINIEDEESSSVFDKAIGFFNNIGNTDNDSKTYEQEREDSYGAKYEDLSSEDKEAYLAAKEADSIKMQLKDNTTEIEEGVVQVQYGDYTETRIELYDGKTYEQLSDEEKEMLEEWQNECKNLSTLNCLNPIMPECPFEQTTEVRVQKTSDSSTSESTSIIDHISSGIKSIFNKIKSFFS